MLILLLSLLVVQAGATRATLIRRDCVAFDDAGAESACLPNFDANGLAGVDGLVEAAGNGAQPLRPVGAQRSPQRVRDDPEGAQTVQDRRVEAGAARDLGVAVQWVEVPFNR
jgi:hypothetical protein